MIFSRSPFFFLSRSITLRPATTANMAAGRHHWLPLEETPGCGLLIVKFTDADWYDISEKRNRVWTPPASHEAEFFCGALAAIFAPLRQRRAYGKKD